MARRTQDGKPQRRLFPADPFDGFGASRFRPAGDPVVGRRLRAKRGGAARLLRGVKDHAPRTPGVYGMLDAKGVVIYIGKAKNLRARLMSYFRVNSRDPKAGRILDRTRFLVWEETADEFAALLRELELIQRFTPKFNVLGQPGNQSYHYVCLDRAPAPYAFVTRTPSGKELGVYGPFVKRWRSEAAVRRVNDWFKLRDCPQTVAMKFSDQGILFPDGGGAKCLRFELATCTGPCAGACSRKEYGAGVRAAKAFLDGRDRTVLRVLRAGMEDAAARFEFERATAMRDRLADLEWLDGRLSLLRRARGRHSCVYPLAGADGKDRWYVIHRGQVRAVAYPPDTAEAADRFAALVRVACTDPPGDADQALPAGTVDSILLVEAWFNKRPDERKKLLAPDVVKKAGEPGA